MTELIRVLVGQASRTADALASRLTNLEDDKLQKGSHEERGELCRILGRAAYLLEEVRLLLDEVYDQEGEQDDDD